MIIRMERSGGFTGIGLKALIDTQQLDPQEGQELIDLVESSNFFEADLSPNPNQAGADRFHYSITIEHGQQRRTVELGEGDIPEDWQMLVQRINMLARRFRG